MEDKQENKALLPYPNLQVGTGGINPAQEQMSAKQRLLETEKQLKSVDDANWVHFAKTEGGFTVPEIGNKWRGFSESWDDTYLGKAVNYAKFDRAMFEEDDSDFRKGWTDEAVVFALEANGLPMEYYGEIKDAKNSAHKERLILGAVDDKNRKDFIQDALSPNEQMLSGFATALVDVDLPIGMAYGGLAKLTKLRRVMTAGAMGTHIGFNKFIYEIDDDVTASEATAFAMLGAAFDGFAVNKMGKASQMGDAVGELPTNDRVSDMKRKIDNADTSRKEMNAYNKELSKQLDIINDMKASEKEVAQAEAKIAELKHNIKSGKDMPMMTEAERKASLNKQRLAEEELSGRELDLETKELGLNERVKSIDDEMTSLELKEKTKLNRKEKAEIKKQKKELVAEKKRLKEDLKTNKKDLEVAKKERRIATYKAKAMQKVKTGYKVLNDKIKKIEAKVKKTALADDVWKAKTLKGLQKNMLEMGEDLAMNVVEWRKYIDDVIGSGDFKAVNNFKKIIDNLHSEGYIAKGEYEHFAKKLKNEGKFETPKITAKLNKDGTYSFVKKNGKKGAVISGLLALSLGSDAMADDGSIVSSDNIFGLIAGAVALGFGIKNFGAISKGLKKTLTEMKHFDKARPFREKVDGHLNMLRTQLTETLTPLLKNETAEFKELVRKLLWDAENGEFLTIDANKRTLFHRFSQKLKASSDIAYNKWLEETGVSGSQARMSNLSLDEVSKRSEFEIKVMEHVEFNKYADSPAIVEAATEVRKVHADIKKLMKESGMEGTETMLDYGENYMTRYTRNAEIRELMKSLSDVELKSFIQQVSKMFDGDIAKTEAYLKVVTESSGKRTAKIINLKQVEEFLTKNKIDMDIDEAAEILGVRTANKDKGASKQTGRTKVRIRLDKSKFETISVTDLEGNTVNMDLNKFFVNNSMENMDRYLNNITGHIAFAEGGFKSIDEFVTQVKASGKSVDNITQVEELAAYITGEPMINVSAKNARTMQILSNLVVAGKMPFSAISLTAEAFTSVFKLRHANFSTVAREAVNIFKRHGKSSAIVDELVNFMGQGNHRQSASYGTYSHIGEGMDNITTKTNGLATKASEIARDSVLYNLGLVPVSDFLTRIHLVDSASYLHDIAHGTKTMPDYMKKIVGLDSDIEKMLKGKLKKVNGELQKMDIENWSRKDQQAFQKVVDNMMMKRIQMTTVGGTPHWSRSGAMGGVMSQLIKFPLQAFSNHGIVDLKGSLLHADPRAMGATFMWFAGSYMAAMMRYEIQGKDYTEDDLIFMGLMGMPLIGAGQALYGVATGGSAMQNSMDGVATSMQNVMRSM